MKKAKKCPMCGSQHVGAVEHTDYLFDKYKSKIECLSCLYHTDWHFGQNIEEAIDKATEEWNKRK